MDGGLVFVFNDTIRRADAIEDPPPGHSAAAVRVGPSSPPFKANLETSATTLNKHKTFFAPTPRTAGDHHGPENTLSPSKKIRRRRHTGSFGTVSSTSHHQAPPSTTKQALKSAAGAKARISHDLHIPL